MDSPIVIVGAGRVGSAFAIALKKCGSPVVAIAGRDPARVESAARTAGGVRAVSLAEAAKLARRLLIAVSDTAIPQVALELNEAGFEAGAVLHTSGCRGPEALAPLAAAGASTGTMHPLQTFPTAQAGAAGLPGSTFAIGGEGEALEWANEMVALFNGKALPIRSEHWALYHAAAVIASNYHATLLDASLECLEVAGISRSDALQALKPLLEGTLQAILRLGPRQALTGPLSRGDFESVRRNRKALELASAPTREIYDSLARRTLEIMRSRGTPPALIEEWKRILL